MDGNNKEAPRSPRRGLTFRRKTNDKKSIVQPDGALLEQFDPAATKLDLKGRKLPGIPPSLLRCTALNFLFLNFNEIVDLPMQMSELTALRTLRLFGNHLETLGPPMDALVNLTLLDLGKNRLTSVDAVAWDRLTALRDLNLQINKLTALPDALGHCTALTTLAVPINRLTTLPPTLHLLSNLQTLDVSHNRLTSLPLDFCELTALTSLNLVGNDLKQLPPQLGGCVRLTELNVQMNLLCELPPELGQLTGLRVLKLMKNQIQEFPREVGNLTGLEELLLSDNQFINLPRTIGQLKRLTSLKASENAFIYLPPELGDLPALRELDLAYNQVEALPRELGRLSSLTTAYLGDNSILTLPREINGLSSLTNLNLFFNKLVDLPPQLGEVVTLATLNCARNRLASLPDSLIGLTRLDTLQLTGNALTQLPDALLQLPRLLHLCLASNALEALPPQLSQLSQLRTLHLSYNPIANALDGLACVASMQWLSELHIAGLGLAMVPQAVFQLTQLHVLALCCNKLTCPLPLEFTALTSLNVLQLSGNQLTALEALPLCQLHGLRELDLCHNRLVLVHDEVCQLTAIQDLDLSANALEHLPQNLALSMPHLTQLKVAYNALRDLPVIPAKHPIWISRHGNPLSDYVKRLEKERRNKGPDPKTIARHLEQRAIKLNKRTRRMTAGVGVRPLSIGWSEMTGGRPDQQDTIAVIREFRGDPHCCYFGVFDGHGGQTTSEFTASYLHVILEENLNRMPIIHEAMQTTFRMMHEEIEAKHLDDGCAALMVYLTRDRIWLANAGDSRAIMCRKGRAVQISRDHKSDSLDEKKRIQALHGYITENARVNGVLALSRALGDVEQQPHVTYRPDVLEMDVSDAIEYIILACDGLWDVMSNDEVVEHVKASASPQEAAIRLRDLAYQLGSTDNISVIVASFLPAHSAAERVSDGRPSSGFSGK